MGRFIIKAVPTGIKFDLQAGNYEVIATSEVYSGLDACEKGIESVRHNAPVAALEDRTVEGFKTEAHPKFEVYTDKGGEFRFRLLARNGQEIAASQAYTEKSGCLHGIESVRQNAPEAEIVDKREQ